METLSRAQGPTGVPRRGFMPTTASGYQRELPEPGPLQALRMAWETAQSKTPTVVENQVLGLEASVDAG